MKRTTLHHIIAAVAAAAIYDAITRHPVTVRRVLVVKAEEKKPVDNVINLNDYRNSKNSNRP